MCTHLWSKVESQIAGSQTKFDKQWDLFRETDLDLIRQVGGLAKLDEVFEGEGKRDGFRQRNRHVLFRLIDAGVWTNADGPGSDIALTREFNAVLGSIDFD